MTHIRTAMCRDERLYAADWYNDAATVVRLSRRRGDDAPFTPYATIVDPAAVGLEGCHLAFRPHETPNRLGVLCIKQGADPESGLADEHVISAFWMEDGR